MAFNDSPELPLALPASLLQITITTGSAGSALYSKRIIILVVTVALTWTTSGQATWRPYGGRAALAASSQAGSALTAAQAFLNAAINLGAAAQTSLPVGSYFIDPTAVPALQWPYPQVGAELVFPSALLSGAATAFLETGP